jgi:hypothetical protein
MQQLVKEFPKSKFFLPSKTTHFSVAVEEPNHPTPKTPQSKTPPSHQTNKLVSAIKKLGKMKSDAGKLCEPKPFTSKDLKKLKTFIFQCQLYFQNSDFEDDYKKVTFALSYL